MISWKQENPIPASQLKITILEKSPADGSVEFKSHFLGIYLDKPGMQQFPLIGNILKKRYI